jgi:hypothetical protein
MDDQTIGSDDLVYRAQAIATGLTDTGLRSDVRKGVTERVWRGVYLPTTGESAKSHTAKLERYRTTVIAATHYGGPGRTASHESGAAMHRIPMLDPDLTRVHLTSSSTGKTLTRGLIHQAALRPSDIVEIDGIPVTSLARTVCDVARTGSLRQAVCVLDSGLRLGITEDELDDQIARLRRHHGIAILRSATSLANGLSESIGESLSRLVMADNPAIPPPELQVSILVNLNGEKHVRGDFGWRDAGGALRVVGEFDGRFKYHRSNPFGDRLPEDVIYDEKLREDAIRATGSRVVRWTWADALRPKVLHAKVIAALTSAGILA